MIATGFNEEALEKKRDERKPMVNVPGVKKEPVKTSEQLSIRFPLPLRKEKTEETDEDTLRDAREAAHPPLVGKLPEAGLVPEPSLRESSALATASALPSSLDFPPFLKPEAMRRGEQRVFVNRGTVMTQFEDDTDVPTFLRKQMQ